MKLDPSPKTIPTIEKLIEDIEYTTFTTGVEYMKFTQAVNESFNGDGERISIPPG